MVRFPRIARSHLRDLLVLACMLLARQSTLWFLLGVGLFLVGLALRVWIKGVLRRNQLLATDGPYQFCRHPFYAANLILDVSLCFIAGVPILALVYLPFFWAAYWPTIRREENALQRRFGESYHRFQREIPTLWPRIPKALAKLRSPWSFAVLLKEREVSRTLRLLAIPLILAWALEVHRGWWEVLEGESLLLLSAAFLLHVTGRFVYLALERGGSFQQQMRFARWGGVLGFTLVLFFLAVEIRVVDLGVLRSHAQRNGAIPVETAAEFRMRAASLRGDSLLTSDDILESTPDLASRYSVKRIFWSEFEVFLLIEPNIKERMDLGNLPRMFAAADSEKIPSQAIGFG